MLVGRRREGRAAGGVGGGRGRRRVGCTFPLLGKGPTPSMPFSACSVMLTPEGT